MIVSDNLIVQLIPAALPDTVLVAGANGEVHSSTLTVGDLQTCCANGGHATVTLGNFTANGPLGTAAIVVDPAANMTIFVPQTSTGTPQLTLPVPTNPAPGRIAFVGNTGTKKFKVNGLEISAGKQRSFVWSGSAWLIPV